MTKKQRILYVGDLLVGGTCLERLHVLQNYGFEIIPMNMRILDVNRLQRSLEHRLLDGPVTRKLNRDILKKAQNIYPDIVWIDKGRNIFGATIEKLKALGILCIHYTADPAFTVHTSRHFNKAVQFYDLCITNKRYEIAMYKKLGVREVLFNYQGANGTRYNNISPVTSDERQGSIFVGHCEKDYIETLTGVGDIDPYLQIHGYGWTRGSRNIVELEGKIRSEGVWGDEYPKALASAKIGFGLLCKAYPDQFTTRTFEIPASGTMLLAERTQEHMDIFREDVEAVFFSGKRELRDKLRKYLENDELRYKIASAGQKKVMTEFTWDKVMKPTIDLIESLI